jgi:hypothetical protein
LPVVIPNPPPPCVEPATSFIQASYCVAPTLSRTLSPPPPWKHRIPKPSSLLNGMLQREPYAGVGVARNQRVGAGGAETQTMGEQGVYYFWMPTIPNMLYVSNS